MRAGLIESKKSRGDLKKQVKSAQSRIALGRRIEQYTPLADPAAYQYINLRLFNDPALYTGPIVAQFVQPFTQPLIEKASNYRVNVERFKVPAALIPIFIMPQGDVYDSYPVVPVPPSPSNPPIIVPATGTYWVTLAYTDVMAGTTTNYSCPLIYSTGTAYSQNWIGQITSYPPLIDINGVTRYGVWKILDFLEMVYGALQIAFNNLIVANPTSAQALAPQSGPLIDYSYAPGGNVVSIIAPQNWSNNSASNIRIYFNYALSQFLPNLRSSLYAITDGQTPSLDYEVQLRNSYLVTIGGNPYIKIPQELPTFDTWSDLQNITFVSSNIPVNPEGTVLGQDADPTGSNVLFSLTDFELVSALNPYSYIVFYLVGPRKYADLRADLPLSKIDVTVYWQNKAGFLFPLQIPPNQNFSMKLLFHRKSSAVPSEK